MVEVPCCSQFLFEAGPVNVTSCALLPFLWGKQWAGAPELMGSCSQAAGLFVGWWLCSKTSSSPR